MLPPGVLHMSALGRFGRFTLFSPRVSHSNTCRLLSFVCFVFLFGFVALVCFCFLFCECLGIPNSPRSLDLDDRQGLIARSAMQQKKNLLPLKMNASLSPNTSPTKLVTFTKKALFFLPQSNASSMIILTLKIGSRPFAPTPSQGSPVKIFSLSQPQRSSGTLASG